MNNYLFIIKPIALIVFVSLIPLLLLVENSTSIVWTVIIPVLPLLFIIIGYSNWRNICPLAFFPKISQNLTWIQKRKLPKWFEENFYLFQYFILFLAFYARLILLNFDTIYLASFLVFVIVSAFFINLIYTGKSWCNFFCPVGVVEKIYCGSNAHNAEINSACSTCSACKINCPDIDMESNYWKESINTQKTFVFYSFSGLVLGFYSYFYLQSGSFDNYYSGRWTYESISMFSDGFFFAPFIPLFIAAPITLIVYSILSYYIFKTIEQVLFKRKIFKDILFSTLQHRIKVVSAFIAFNIFYIFAGAPAYMNYPIAYSIFYFIVVMVSAIVLHREIFREESYFLQERFAIKMIKRWDSTKAIPTNLKEIYYTYTNENHNKKEQLQTYKETIEDLLQEGILTEDRMSVLEKLRTQMGISQKEHLKIINNIKLKNEDLFNIDIKKSTEKRYQKNSYKMILENALEEHTELDQNYLISLRRQFCITDDMHNEIMNSILNTNDKLHSDVLYLLKQMNSLRKLHKSILNDGSREILFLKYTIKNEFNLISKDLFILLNSIYKDNTKNLYILKRYFKYKRIGEKINFDKNILSFMDPKIASAILELKKDFDSIKEVKVVTNNKPIIKHLLTNDSESIAAAALLNIIHDKSDFFDDINLSVFRESKNIDLKELADKITFSTNNITIYERMMYLHHIPLFEPIKLYELNLLANSTEVVLFKKDRYIIEQGTDADTLFIITSGEVDVQTDAKVTNRLGDKDYFGAVAILSDRKRTASVKSITNVTMLTLSKYSFKNFIYENPKISVKLMKDVISKLIDK